MLRLWLFICLMLLAPVGGGLAHALGPAQAETCLTGCSDDDAQGQCAPTCVDCTCCTHAKPLAVAVPLPGLADSRFQDPPLTLEAAEPSSADADDILHVPIVPLA
ncbi:hypothetical protein [Corallococcus carmarthensis]|uniref:Secreted protein n=1 Tax=Corallococcus carmarthensis TaxID=2316728 RepID=A0A3A8JQ42_9BACT|nr:hypothetical protein [Corallococcus carmarthensis]NOK19954.1 hypothetical protein [Corallococcus carmarthensis]RKG97335.1 hypothetical protein D7X32_33005 [Corallococcus carmarthensis]